MLEIRGTNSSNTLVIITVKTSQKSSHFQRRQQSYFRYRLRGCIDGFGLLKGFQGSCVHLSHTCLPLCQYCKVLYSSHDPKQSITCVQLDKCTMY